MAIDWQQADSVFRLLAAAYAALGEEAVCLNSRFIHIVASYACLPLTQSLYFVLIVLIKVVSRQVRRHCTVVWS